jgi:pilus assembly protein CpaF
LTAETLVANKSITPEMLEFLAAAVKAKLCLLISGGTGAGKTTLLNILSRFIGDRGSASSRSKTQPSCNYNRSM